MIIVVGVADCRVTNDVSNVLITYALGSHASAFQSTTLWRGVGACCTFMLPEAPAAQRRTARAVHVPIAGIPMMFREAYGRAPQKRRLRGCVWPVGRK